jgi:hypothetical protein
MSDARLAVGLARSERLDLRFFLKPPNWHVSSSKEVILMHTWFTVLLTFKYWLSEPELSTLLICLPVVGHGAELFYFVTVPCEWNPTIIDCLPSVDFWIVAGQACVLKAYALIHALLPIFLALYNSLTLPQTLLAWDLWSNFCPRHCLLYIYPNFGLTYISKFCSSYRCVLPMTGQLEQHPQQWVVCSFLLLVLCLEVFSPGVVNITLDLFGFLLFICVGNVCHIRIVC